MDFTIEAGEFYKTRSGRKVRIYATECGAEKPIHGATYNEGEFVGTWTPRAWCDNGRYLAHNFEHELDITTQWTKEDDDRGSLYLGLILGSLIRRINNKN